MERHNPDNANNSSSEEYEEAKIEDCEDFIKPMSAKTKTMLATMLAN